MDIACTVIIKIIITHVFSTIISIRRRLQKLLNYNMKKVIFVAGVAVLALAAVTSAAFSTNLTVGSTGADVSALQTWLITNGFHIAAIESGAASKGYFGSQTKMALAAYQTSVGLPAYGFFGPLTQAKLNGGVVGTTPTSVACPAGYTCTAIPGTTPTTGGTAPTGITTPGLEGTLSVTQGAVSNSTLYVGDMKAPVLSLALQAQTSDIAVQRVQLDLGSNSTIYTKKFSNVYVIGDNGQVLASMPLNINTVTKSNNEYYVTLTGFSYIIPKNSPNRYLTIAVDVMPSVDTVTYGSSATISLSSVQPVRGIDGAGISQYAGDASIAQTVTLNQSLADSADIKISTDVSNSGSTAIIANSGPNNDQADKVTTLVFAVKAEKDNVGITQVVATTTVGGVANNASTTNAYLYDGSTLIASASIGSTGVATFSNINGSTGYVVPANTTKAFTIKVDIRTAGVAPANVVTTVTNLGVSAQNSQGSNLTGGQITGSAVTPNSLAVQKAGPVFTLIGTPTVSKSVIGQTASSTFATAFTFSIAAQGTSVSIGSTGAFVVGVYVNGSSVGTINASYEKPVSGVTGSGPYVIADGSTATFTARASFVGPQGVYLPAGGIVTTRIESVNGSYTYVSDSFRAAGDGAGNTITL